MARSNVLILCRGRRSSKNRRKAASKMYSLKEGSRFEDFALMKALSDIIEAVNKSTGMNSVHSLVFLFASSSVDCTAVNPHHQ